MEWGVVTFHILVSGGKKHFAAECGEILIHGMADHKNQNYFHRVKIAAIVNNMNATMQNPGIPTPYSKEIAKNLLELGTVQLNVQSPFTWVSGIRAPIYCDNRLINSIVPVRKLVINAFVDLIKEKFADAEIITGIATGGISFGALIADRLNLPFTYVRQKPKEHGLKKQVEGVYTKGSKVVVIEDHISTGGSSIAAIEALKQEELQILGLISIMTYDFDVAAKAFLEHHVIQYSLCNLDVVLDVALQEGRINENEKQSILAFRNSPGTWLPSK